VADILLMNNTGTVQVIDGTPSFQGNFNLLNTATPAIILDGVYNSVPTVTTVSGQSANLSDYLAELVSGIPLSSTGVRILTMQQGALSSCSFEQVAAGNLTLAAWEQNVALLNAIAAYCRVNDITVQVETQLGWTGSFGAPQTDQWLDPALAAGLPIGYVEDDNELGSHSTIISTGTTVVALPPGGYSMTSSQFTANATLITQDLSIMAGNELADIAIIHAAYPDAVFGEWDPAGAADSVGQTTGYHEFLQDWYSTLAGSAAVLGLPGLSFVIADQYYSPDLASNGTVSDVGQGTFVAASNVAEISSFVQDAAAEGVTVEIQDYAISEDLSPLQVLARQELEISQEAKLGISGIQFGGGLNPNPVSEAVNLPGSTFNGAAEAAAIEPLYQAGKITTAGSIGLVLPTQVVLAQGATKAVGGITISAQAMDQSNRLAVVLIDQTGTLSATQHGGATVGGNGANELILDGTPGDVEAELATLTISETVSGPDSIDVEVFGSSGRVGGGTIAVLATNSNGSTNYTQSSAGALPQIWDSASATLNSGTIVSESYVWNSSDGLSAAAFIGGATIAPVMDLLVDQPLLEQGLTVSGTVASLPATDLGWASGWQVYEPIAPAVSSQEGVPVTITASTLTYDSAGKLMTESDTIGSMPLAEYSGNFPSIGQPYYFTNGGTAVTQYNTGDNTNFPTTLYDNGAGAIALISSGATMQISVGSTIPMVVGSIQTIYGIVSGTAKVVEVRYLGGADNPYDEVDQIFNPYSATPQLWQQINTVGIPVSMAGATPLAVPSATTVTEYYGTGNNPDWNSTAWVGDQAVATTFESGNWDSTATITTAGSVAVTRGVTWIGEGEILNDYTLTAPTAAAASAIDTVAGTGIAGDWVVATGGNGVVLGDAQVAGNGQWHVTYAGTILPTFDSVTAQQFDLAGDESPVAAMDTDLYQFISGSTLDLLSLTGTIVVNLNAQGTMEIESQTVQDGLSGLTAVDAAGSTGPVTLTGLTAGGSTLIGGSGNTTVNVSGTGNIVSLLNSGTIVETAANTTATVTGTDVTALLNYTGDQIQAINNNDTIIAVSGDQVGVYGAGDVVTASGITVNTASSASSVTVNGTSDVIGAAAGSTIDFGGTSTATVFGDGATIVATSAGSSLFILANSDVMTAHTGASISIYGTNETVNNGVAGASIYLANNAVATINGSGGTFDIVGTNVVATASGENVVASAGTSFDLYGSNNVVTLSSASSVQALNNGDTITAVSGDQIGVYGTGEVVYASGITLNTAFSTTSVTMTGTSDVVGAASGSTIDFGGASNATVFGDGATIVATSNGSSLFILANSDVMTAHTGASISIYGTNETVSNVVAGTSVTFANNATATINGSGGTFDIAGTNIAVTASGETVTTNASTSFALNLNGGSDTVNMGTGTSFDIIGSSGTIGFISGAAVTMSVTAAVGSQTVGSFNMANGDKIDLTYILAGTSVTTSDLSSYVSASASGTGTSLAIIGPNGSDTVLLSGVGSLSLQTLINGNAFVLPSH
jgi:trimeric autotransporter adhesin